jgi:hypothetical protein
MQVPTTIKNLKGEIWKSIPGYEGLYSVSNMGRIKSHERIDPAGRCLPESIKKPSTHRTGYLNIDLFKNGRRTRRIYGIHRLVLLAFVGQSKLKCNHKNCNKADNRLENLEYVTQKENIRHALQNGLMEASINGLRNATSRLKVPVEGVSIVNGSVIRFDSFTQAGNFFDRPGSHIQDAASGRIRSAYGYKWRRVEQHD